MHRGLVATLHSALGNTALYLATQYGKGGSTAALMMLEFLAPTVTALLLTSAWFVIDLTPHCASVCGFMNSARRPVTHMCA
jgi:hypothetical protein